MRLVQIDWTDIKHIWEVANRATTRELTSRKIDLRSRETCYSRDGLSGNQGDVEVLGRSLERGLREPNFRKTKLSLQAV